VPRTFEGRPKAAITVTEIEGALRCLYRAWREYLAPEAERRAYVTLSQARGTAVHAAARASNVRLVETGEHMRASDVADLAAAAYDEATRSPALRHVASERSRARLAVGEERDRTVRLAALWRSDLAPSIRPVAVEERFFIALPDQAFDLSGQIDWRDERQLRDLKTARRRPSADAAHRSHQLTMYALGVRTMTGAWPSAVGLDALVDGRVPKVSSLDSTRGPREAEVLLARLNAYLSAIDRGVWIPASEHEITCGPNVCPHWDECPFVNSARLAATEANVDDGG
jgi:hypothetical protein